MSSIRSQVYPRIFSKNLEYLFSKQIKIFHIKIIKEEWEDGLLNVLIPWHIPFFKWPLISDVIPELALPPNTWGSILLVKIRNLFSKRKEELEMSLNWGVTWHWEVNNRAKVALTPDVTKIQWASLPHVKESSWKVISSIYLLIVFGNLYFNEHRKFPKV